MTAIDREQLLEDLQSLASTVDGPPEISTVASECEGTIRDYVEEFNTWYNALEAAEMTGTQAPPAVDRHALINDLKRLASELDRSPTSEHIDQLGQYDIETYERVFGSYILALEAAGIEPNTTQYNFAVVDPPDHRAGTKNVRYLKDHGPTPSSEMPLGSNVSDREHGMWKFVVSAGQPSTDAAGGVPEPVYYLKDVHDPETVMRAFFAANEQMLKRKTYHGLITGIRNYNPTWADRAKQFLPELMDAKTDKGEEPSGMLVVEAANETLTNAIEQTVASQTSNLDVIDGVDTSDGYVWGLPEDNEDLWQQVLPGDLVLAITDESVYAFMVDEVLQDWNATTELWAQYEDGVRVAGPDRPWPFLLTGTTGGEVSLDGAHFWDLISAEQTAAVVQYVEAEEFGDLREEYANLWQFRPDRKQTSDTPSAEPSPSDDEGKSGATPLNSAESLRADGSNDGDSDIAEIDIVIATLAARRDESFVKKAVSDHLKRAVDGVEPTIDEVTAAKTAPVPLNLTSNQRAFIETLCGDGEDYASVAAFVEDALRAQLDIPNTEQELSITVDEPTVRVLEQLAAEDEEGKSPEQLIKEQIRALIANAS